MTMMKITSHANLIRQLRSPHLKGMVDILWEINLSLLKPSALGDINIVYCNWVHKRISDVQPN